MKAITSTVAIGQPVAPNLPLAPDEYSRQYHDQLNNVLRLYFNLVGSALNQLQATDILPALTNYTVEALPSAATSGAGARSFVTDATAPAFGAAAVGGGTVATPVYSDGTSWIVG